MNVFSCLHCSRTSAALGIRCFLYAQRSLLLYTAPLLFPVSHLLLLVGLKVFKDEIFRWTVSAKCASISGKCCGKTLLYYTLT